ncbi:hypothetical protein MRX96_017717 [Rhipicephalus microplus]
MRRSRSSAVTELRDTASDDLHRSVGAAAMHRGVRTVQVRCARSPLASGLVKLRHAADAATETNKTKKSSRHSGNLVRATRPCLRAVLTVVVPTTIPNPPLSSRTGDTSTLEKKMMECSNLFEQSRGSSFAKPRLGGASGTTKHSYAPGFNMPRPPQLGLASHTAPTTHLPVWCQRGDVPAVYRDLEQQLSGPSGINSTLVCSLLLSSGLSRSTLGRIWDICSRTVPGSLTQPELYATLAMVALVQKGYPPELELLFRLPQPPIPMFAHPVNNFCAASKPLVASSRCLLRIPYHRHRRRLHPLQRTFHPPAAKPLPAVSSIPAAAFVSSAPAMFAPSLPATFVSSAPTTFASSVPATFVSSVPPVMTLASQPVVTVASSTCQLPVASPLTRPTVGLPTSSVPPIMSSHLSSTLASVTPGAPKGVICSVQCGRGVR